MKEMEDDKEVVDRDNSTETVPLITVNNIEITYLKDLLKQKDLPIKNQQDFIDSLKSQITLINQYATPSNGTNQINTEFHQNDSNNAIQHEAFTGNIKNIQKPWETSGQKQKKENLKEVYMNGKTTNNKKVSVALLQVESENKMKEIINLTENGDDAQS
ncbi:hypothetical protein JTB14_025254 [Gonioctena quinquepunctata]|nr:hypothetical protein JTB14_025254 [Gonioctena quinquepunctata]